MVLQIVNIGSRCARCGKESMITDMGLPKLQFETGTRD